MKRFGTNNRDPDREVMARIVKGDPEAMDVLYDRHSRQVYALLFRIVGERQKGRRCSAKRFPSLLGPREHLS